MPTLLGSTRTIKPLLSGLKALQARYLCAQIDVLPFRVEAGRLQFVYPTEKLVDKARNTTIARRARAPVVRSENRGNRNRGDPLAFGDKVRIIRWVKIRGKIVIFEFRAIFDRQEFETFLPFSLYERVDWLSKSQRRRRQFLHASFARALRGAG